MAHAPGMHEEMFMSPYSDHKRADPEEEVHLTVQRVSSSPSLNPVVDKFLQEPGQKDLFLEVFARQANLIKSRCQAFDDCHVTVYDKVLLVLTDNGNRLDSVAAQEYFCEEFLGISTDGSMGEAKKILDQSVLLKGILARAAHPHGKYGENYSSETMYGGRDHQLRPAGSGPSTKDDKKGAKITRLTSLYEKAKSDFESTSGGGHRAKVDAARFLRDTAENTFIYFREILEAGDGSHISPELMHDLEQTCKSSQASVVSLSGGRKRKFDRHDYTVPSVSPRGPFYWRSPGYGTDLGRADSRSAPMWQGSSRKYSRLGSEESSWQRPHPPPPPPPPPPFSYRRPVDSYQPSPAAGTSAQSGGSHSHPYMQSQYHEASAPAPDPATRTTPCTYRAYTGPQKHDTSYEHRHSGAERDREREGGTGGGHAPGSYRSGGSGSLRETSGTVYRRGYDY